MATVQASTAPAKVTDELAARGLRTYSNHLRYAPPSVQNAEGGDPMSAALQGAEAGEAVPDAETAKDQASEGGAVPSAAPTTIDPALAQQFEQAAAQSPQDGGDSIILPLLAVGALGATALTAYRVWKSGRPAPTAPIDGAGGAPSGGTALAPNTGGPTGNPQQALLDAGDGSVYGEFKEVNEPRLPPPSTQNRPKPATVAEALTATPGAQRRLSREQASAVQQRSARVQPNDMPTMAGHDEFPYTEEQVRHANALADELIAQRLRGQRLRSRGTTGRAGAPSAPINPRRPSAGVSEARPSLVNEILGIMRRGIVR